MINKKIYISLLLLLLPCFIFAAEDNAGTDAQVNNPEKISLDDYRKTAVSNNVELHTVKAESEYAGQQSKAAFTKYFPKISAGAAIANTDILPGLNEPVRIYPITGQSNGASVVTIGAVQPLFMGGRIINGNKLARTAAKASDYKLKIKQNEVFAEAEKKYRDYQLLEDKMDTLSAYEKMLDSLYGQISQAFKNGIVSKSDFLRVKLKKEEIGVQKEQLLKMTEIAAKDLKLYAGIDEDRRITVDKSFPEVEEPVYKRSDFQSYLKQRPEYMLLEAAVKSAKLQRNIEAGSYMPAVTVGASVFRTDYFGNNYFDKSAIHYQDTMAFATVSVPLSDWWEASHTIKAKNAKYMAAKEELDSKSKYLILDMDKKLTLFETAYSQVRVAEIGFEFAKTNRTESEDGYNNGTEKLSDYLEAIALEQEKQNKLDEAKSNYFQAGTAFFIAIGKMEY